MKGGCVIQKRLNAGMFFIAALLATGPRVCLGSGYEFEGIGAREVSRGGAAIADSPDWTAIYWNPANIQKAVENSRLDAGLEVFAGQANATDGNSLSSLPVGAIFSKHNLSSGFVLGALGAVMKLGDRFGLGVGVYTPLLQGVDFSDDSKTTPSMHLDYEGAAGIVTFALEASMRVSEKLSAGAGVNILYGRLTSKSTLTNFLFPANTATSELKGDGAALEGIFGLHYQAAPTLALGAVYRTGADVGLKGDAKVTNTFFPEENSEFRYELRHPPTTGVGVSYKPVEQWTFNFDFTQTYWHRFSSAFAYKQDGLFLQDTRNGFNWRDSWKLRFGSGWWVTGKTELLAGYSYDRAALDPGSVDFATAVDVPMNRIYGGASHRWSERWESTLGGVYGAGRRSEGDVTYRLSGWQVMLETRLRV